MICLTPDDLPGVSAVKKDEVKEIVSQVCKDLEPTCNVNVVNVTQMRDTKNMRQQVLNGGITLITPGGGATDDASKTAVMISLDSLQQLIANAIGKTLELQETREHPADILAGLPDVPAEAEPFEVDLGSAARFPAAHVSSFLKL